MKKSMECLECGAIAIKCGVKGCRQAPCEHMGQASCLQHSIYCKGKIKYYPRGKTIK